MLGIDSPRPNSSQRKLKEDNFQNLSIYDLKKQEDVLNCSAASFAAANDPG